MGHIELARLKKTRPWVKVAEYIAAGADVAKVAEATVSAAEKALASVQGDVGFREAVYLLTQIGIAAS